MDSKQANRIRSNGIAAGREDSRWMRERIAELEKQRDNSAELMEDILRAKNKRIAELEAAMSEAIEDIEDWAAYADDYFREKYDLQGCLEKHRAKLDAQEKDDG